MIRSGYIEQLEYLNKSIVTMGLMCENSLELVNQALQGNSKILAKEIMFLSKRIEEKEKELENLCIKLLLKQQPVASDLRKVSAALKIVTDCRRIGEQAANIGEIFDRADYKDSQSIEIVRPMAEATKDLITTTIEAFEDDDLELARKIDLKDDVVDELFAKTKKELIVLIKEDKEDGKQILNLLMVAKYFEKISDHAVNISKWIIFGITGEHGEE